MNDSVIEIRGVSKTFRSGLRRVPVHALREVDVTVGRGTVTAFVGPNGAGKTTTINTVLGFLKPDHGSVSVFGLEAGSREARRRLGFQSEIFHPYPFHTARGALEFYGRLSGQPHEDLAEAVEYQLERLGLGDSMDRKVGTFSKGMNQRLGLAQALLHRPELLLLDEPTTGLDPQGRKLVADIIREEQANGTTVFLSSHILSDIERTCDRLIMIRNGEIVLEQEIGARIHRDGWEIEVLGWGAGADAGLARAGFRPARVGGAVACFECSSAEKNDLLRRVLDLSLDVGAIRRATPSLEEIYMEHVEGRRGA